MTEEDMKIKQNDRMIGWQNNIKTERQKDNKTENRFVKYIKRLEEVQYTGFPDSRKPGDLENGEASFCFLRKLSMA